MEKTSRSERPGRRRPGSPRARLFLALDPPAAVRDELGAWRDSLCAGRDDLRPVAPGALHVTLVFLGYRPEKEIEAIAEAAFEPLRGRGPLELRPAGVRALPPRRPRLFALDLEDAGGACAALQADAEGALAAARFHRPEKRKFWPHVTLARVKRDRRAGPLEAPGELPGAFSAADVVLYRSLLSPRGARYEPLARLVLR
ncbi:MAG: RNA 2',3'-cyclic phosphodiesterase [Thermoleophilaceae bacterium]